MHRLDFFPANELIGQYRQVFSTRNGLEVLTHILGDLGVMQQMGTEEDVALKNYGNRLLSILAGGEVSANSVQEFAERIMRQPIPKEQNNE